MSALLEIDDLRVTFGGTAAVRGISLTVQKGETHCLVGESGCGKSVTSLAVMGLLAKGGSGSEIVVFPNVDHGFNADYRPTYRKEAADDGWARCLAWFKAHGAA